MRLLKCIHCGAIGTSVTQSPRQKLGPTDVHKEGFHCIVLLSHFRLHWTEHGKCGSYVVALLTLCRPWAHLCANIK